MDALHQAWDFDNTSFANGEVPGDTRFFDLSPQNADESRQDGHEGYSILRWTFLHPDVGWRFSVNVSGLLLLGTPGRAAAPVAAVEPAAAAS